MYPIPSPNTSLVIILFKNYRHVILQPYADETKECMRMNHQIYFPKKSVTP